MPNRRLFLHSLTLQSSHLNRKATDHHNSNTVIGTLVVDGWAVTFDTARRGLGGATARPGPSSLYQM